jgi:hypothetical protein
MTTKERILHELDQLDEEELEILYQLIEQFLTARQRETSEPGFLERLAKIQIDGPVDFASEHFWLAASQPTLESIWDNEADDVYSELLQA